MPTTRPAWPWYLAYLFRGEKGKRYRKLSSAIKWKAAAALLLLQFAALQHHQFHFKRCHLSHSLCGEEVGERVAAALRRRAGSQRLC